MTSLWWAAFGPAEASVGCGSGQHRLRWAGGAVDAVDHPDAEGELVIAALGGAATPCLDLVRVWGSHCDDLTVLAVGPRSADDQLTIGPDAIEELVSPSPHGRGALSPATAWRVRISAMAPRPPTAAPSSAVPSPAQPPSAPPHGSAASGPIRSSMSIYTSVIRVRKRSSGAMSGRAHYPSAPFFTEHTELSALMALGQPGL